MTARAHDQVVAEERATRARARQLERAQAAAAEARKTDWRRRLAVALATIDTRGCRCGLHAGMSREDLRALGGGCSSPRWVCPALDMLRRKVGA